MLGRELKINGTLLPNWQVCRADSARRPSASVRNEDPWRREWSTRLVNAASGDRNEKTNTAGVLMKWPAAVLRHTFHLKQEEPLQESVLRFCYSKSAPSTDSPSVSDHGQVGCLSLCWFPQKISEVVWYIGFLQIDTAESFCQPLTAASYLLVRHLDLSDVCRAFTTDWLLEDWFMQK